ncbi:MAG: hypothetical protein FD123_2572 [Bacteroidetes bacterium]|nr:MAG: hypothetical protein FD123_2572 [Bacteroidota bacterium]
MLEQLPLFYDIRSTHCFLMFYNFYQKYLSTVIDYLKYLLYLAIESSEPVYYW